MSILLYFFALIALMPFGVNCLQNYSKYFRREEGSMMADAFTVSYQVSIRRKDKDKAIYGEGHYCSGALINRRAALSSAHCFVEYDKYSFEIIDYVPYESLLVVMGNLNRKDEKETFQTDVTKIVFTNPIYNPKTLQNNIALVYLNQSSPLRTIGVRKTKITAGRLCKLSGWGESSKGAKMSELLLEMEVPIVDKKKCKDLSNIPKGTICAMHGDETDEKCFYDPGAPLVCRHLLTGIASAGWCGQPRSISWYTEVAYHAEWIEEELRSVRYFEISSAGRSNTKHYNKLMIAFYFIIKFSM